ncbi:MAG: uroporphyrinogen decarboxylase family protein [Lachnospiraceae bacterium]|nr:uroporphyrinogen decarboxylase family protein [Lachnospiraceae bacterium]
MNINMREWVKILIESEQRIGLPIMTHSGIELLGKTVLDAVKDGATHYQAVKMLAAKYPSAASTVIMDLTVEAEAFGAEIHFSDHEVPSVIGRLVSDRESVEKLQIPKLQTARIPEYLKANQLIAAESTKPVISGCIGPYSLAGRLYDMSEIMMAMYIEPDCIKLLLEKCTTFILQYCKALKSAGANAVLVAEPAAGLLSNDACKEFSSVYVKQLVDELQDDNFLVFLHNCGNTGQCTEAMVYTGAAGYHFGNSMNMVSALDHCPADALVMGNIDPVSLFKMATADELYQATWSLLEKTERYPNFVISSGCDTPPAVPFFNIDMFYKAIADFNQK